MPSFDIVSEVDNHELTNAVDQANKEVTSRFDFKGTDSKFEQNENTIKMLTESEFQLEQMWAVLLSKISKRGIDVRAIERKDADIQMKTAKQDVIVKQGIETVDAKKIVKLIKDSKIKVQAQIQGESVRVTGKNRDDLQASMALLRADETIGLPLQYNNFRD
jgi:uncharacterized protein YajQ (UPF0234 family)